MRNRIAPISARVRRRFVMGKQGLWPGRRWTGREGLAEALSTAEAVQMDPVAVLCQSHDLVLWGRVLSYTPDDLQQLLHKERHFFDYGTSLMIYPVRELPFWRLHMKRICLEERWATFAQRNAPLISDVLQKVREEGPLRKRDFGGSRVDNYRGSKDTGVALYYLWLKGELMTHSRNGKERLYELAERLLPDWAAIEAPVAEAESYFARKAVALAGLLEARRFRNIWRGFIRRPVDPEEAQSRLRSMLAAEVIADVQVEGGKETRYVLAGDLATLADLQQGHVPSGWEPLSETTEEEATFLSPLEYVSARGRAKKLFNFDFIWEIYKPAAKRKYGPYTLPVLFGDRLVARMDARLIRDQKRLLINGFWLEEGFMPDAPFKKSLQRGIDRLRVFLGAEQLEGAECLP